MIGCGKMGGALLSHWMRGDEEFTIVDPALDAAPDGARLVRDRSTVADERFDVVIVAIKPQMIDDILPDYAPMLAEGGYVLSIAAGCSLARLSRLTGGAPVVRVMPNLPAAVGKGVSGICADDAAQGAPLAHARAMMERTGTAVVVDSEDKIDRVTAVAGSGPGYVFEIARAYVEAAMAMGFDREEARALVLGTMEGAIAMALEPDAPGLEDLRNSVTSKGGTTAAGLAALNGDDTISTRLRETLEAAYNRAVELR
ncbi:pyrroline-5-carboxylate reductase [Qipengyuania sp. 6B39]|uniref:pyrroline-5-carboxylate reductase family protein n=1 Tax=Qipengyuania proteolytica TaxID=2867239 RepID=UPI001C893B66|nr:pyrroline-5-carboxylate reductase [Qipengyuania proteolytica]MBX7496300.1 pyrroline-5-carboxylate reductase [Qipengyuania proteolytica]